MFANKATYAKAKNVIDVKATAAINIFLFFFLTKTVQNHIKHATQIRNGDERRKRIDDGTYVTRPQQQNFK